MAFTAQQAKEFAANQGFREAHINGDWYPLSDWLRTSTGHVIERFDKPTRSFVDFDGNSTNLR